MTPIDRLQHSFEARVERVPQALCVVTPQREWRYTDLNAEANRLAHHPIGQCAVMLSDTQMEPRGVLAPLSLVMKGESLPAATAWRRIPAESGDDLAGCGITCPGVCRA